MSRKVIAFLWAMVVLVGTMSFPVSAAGAGAHMWNYVQLDGAWYPVDTTWDDPIVAGGGSILRHDFLLIAGGAFDGTHRNSGNFSSNTGTFLYSALSASAYNPATAKIKVTGAPTVSGTCTYGQKLSVLTLGGADTNFTEAGNNGTVVPGTLNWQEPNMFVVMLLIVAFAAALGGGIWYWMSTQQKKHW